MRRSPISNGVLLLVCLVILAKLINATNGANGTNENAEKNTPDGGISLPVKRPLYAKDGFLAGEDTPVWFAKVNEGKIKYRRVKSGTTPIVLKSVNLWNSLKNGTGFPVRQTQSFDFSRNFTSSGQFAAARDAGNASFHSSRPVEKQSAIGNEVLYPSILVVVDYLHVFSKAEKNMPSFVEYLVLYILAFWGTVDSSLRNIQNPRVSLRIAGIIITKKRAASPYMISNDGPELFARALSPMMDYWRSVSKKNKNIPIGSYDIVAHMTDKSSESLYTDWEAVIRGNKPNRYAAAVEGPPCKLPDKIAGLIIYDDFNFDGLHRTIAAMSKVLGGSDQSPTVYGWPRRIWTKEIVDPISNALKDASCMSAPKEHYRPGTPIAPILAGELWPTEKRCESANYEPVGMSCWDASEATVRSNCRFLSCPTQRASGTTCVRVGLMTLDGSFCNSENTKICLDGECVDKA